MAQLWIQENPWKSFDPTQFGKYPGTATINRKPEKPELYEADFRRRKKYYGKIFRDRCKIIRKMEKNHQPKKKIYSSRKIKKTIRSPDFKKQLISAFQAVAN